MFPLNLQLTSIFSEYADEVYNASLYTDKSYAVKKVDLYPDFKHISFNDDEVFFLLNLNILCIMHSISNNKE